MTTYQTHRLGYYGTLDGTVVYSGPSLLTAARVAARGKGPYGFQVVAPENYDEDFGLTSREQDIVASVEWIEYKKAQRAKGAA